MPQKFKFVVRTTDGAFHSTHEQQSEAGAAAADANLRAVEMGLRVRYRVEVETDG